MPLRSHLTGNGAMKFADFPEIADLRLRLDGFFALIEAKIDQSPLAITVLG